MDAEWEETLGRENVGVGIVLTGETGGEQRSGDHAAGHAPLAEAGGDVQKRRGRGIGADVRHAVERHAVLRGPGERLLRRGKEPLRLRAQTVVAVAEVFAAAVPASAEEQIVPAAAQAPALLTRVEPHPGERRRAGQRKEDTSAPAAAAGRRARSARAWGSAWRRRSAPP